jgi:hypothetical protein
LGAYRLEADMSWTPAEKMTERSEEIELLENIMKAQQSMFEDKGLFSLPSSE